jgi:hypothetical protein
MNKMFKYFKELLDTLKNIDEGIKKQDLHLEKLSSCVTDNSHRHGKNVYLTTGHWNS